ncbi:MAG TPA: hypothetical protein VE844_13880 [Gammaproteobacteria bacterium]|nr:hypothetical protein [Gammaproteobacteria bacterium]
MGLDLISYTPKHHTRCLIYYHPVVNKGGYEDAPYGDQCRYGKELRVIARLRSSLHYHHPRRERRRDDSYQQRDS